MTISSRTPEGTPNRCPICGHELKIEPSRPTLDAPCPYCGHLLWFSNDFRQFLAEVVKPGQLISKDVETNIKFWIAEIDKKLSAQLNEVMHHPDFQKLEATWRGLHYLVQQAETGEALKIEVLNVSKSELARDQEKADEVDQSVLFQKLYHERNGQPEAEPYGLLVGDFEFDRRPEDIHLLKRISNIAAAAHAPFVAGPAPKLFNIERFTELPAPRDLAKVFESVEYAPWKSFRESDDSRFVALTMPHLLARLPYGEKFGRVDEFNYEALKDGKDHDEYLWMSAAWAYAARVTDAFSKYGWFVRTLGVEGGGKVEGIPIHTFPADDGGVAMYPTEIALCDFREYWLSNLGFLPLMYGKIDGWVVFMGDQSCQKPRVYFDPAANANAELLAKFNLTLCISRLLNGLVLQARGRIAGEADLKEWERRLNVWIGDYVRSGTGPGQDELSKPFTEARVELRWNRAAHNHRVEAEVFLRFAMDGGIVLKDHCELAHLQ